MSSTSGLSSNDRNAYGSTRYILSMVSRFGVGDRVRVDIPDEMDPDFGYHRERGEVVAVHEDEVENVTGDERDRYLYDVRLDDGTTVSLRWRDLRPTE